jgi:hypothetical protein
MTKDTASKVADVGIAVNVAAGHVGEMAGQAIQAAAHAVGCATGKTAGKAVEAAGKAWADTAVKVGTRDAARFSDKT